MVIAARSSAITKVVEPISAVVIHQRNPGTVRCGMFPDSTMWLKARRCDSCRILAPDWLEAQVGVEEVMPNVVGVCRSNNSALKFTVLKRSYASARKTIADFSVIWKR